ncbi:hypothetical protein [Hymenobacter sp. YC55]|uniref:hypothetical protein n=1 Tax=Hymenobacter sp. YC55 TaxID=3034019 RepID=UPI0023F78B57|nr:hypothetical protein [Hymenobacter sp. YC55]MDF7810908.1 hypothetical protein [Hymenobacter sp. YC55]
MMGDTVQVMNASYSRISETRIKVEMNNLADQPIRKLIPLPRPMTADYEPSTGTDN